jgi:class 3 adenylate cyclase
MSEIAGAAVVSRLMAWVAERLRQSRRAVLATNTWGDALHVVFKSVAEAGRFALALQHYARKHVVHPRSREPLLRIGVHAGPARMVRDHLTGRKSYLGNQVNWAARIEPITVPGEVYASQPFAALAALDKCEFSCEYAGVVPLAKGSGSFPLFCVGPARSGLQ